jgi:hypothetical protein
VLFRSENAIEIGMGMMAWLGATAHT